MGLCDVCKTELPEGTKFCPRCGLEFVPKREQAARPPSLGRDVFEWDEPPDAPKDYGVSKQQEPTLTAEKVTEILGHAQTRLQEGAIVEMAAALRRVQHQVARHPSLWPKFEALHQSIEAKQQAVRTQCARLIEESDCDSLVTLLVGPATNVLEPEAICELALTAAQTFYDRRLAEQAHDVLRLPPFRTLRQEDLVQRHRELESRVHRRRQWQHWRQSVTFVGGAAIITGIGLAVWAWFIWQSSSIFASRLFVPALLLAAAFLAFLPKFRPKLEKWLRKEFEDESPGQKVMTMWKHRRRPRK